MAKPEVRALVFDVFGTVVDWRSSVVRECQAFGREFGIAADWEDFTDRWRYEGYIGGISAVFRGDLPFMTADELHRRKLDSMLAELGVEVPETAIDHLNRAWHRLEPWPDSVEGLSRLKAKYVIATLSNGNISLLVNMAKRAGLPWDAVLSAEITGAFKPAPECYQRGAAFLGFEPAEVMLIAAHKNDLQAAQAAGLRAGFVPRPTEAGPSRAPDLTHDPAFDVNADSFLDLAQKLGC